MSLITAADTNDSLSGFICMIEWNTCVDEDTVYAALFPATMVAGIQAKAYWQHTREVISSRRAKRALCHLCIPLTTCVVTQQQQSEQAQTEQTQQQ
jgi:hypothetical protein